MLHCNSAIAAVLLAGAALSLPAQKPPNPDPAQAPSLTVDRDPVRSPDGASIPANAAVGNPTGSARKAGRIYSAHQDVEEVVLNATVLDGNRLVQDLKKGKLHLYLKTGSSRPLSAFSTPTFRSPLRWWWTIPDPCRRSVPP